MALALNQGSEDCKPRTLVASLVADGHVEHPDALVVFRLTTLWQAGLFQVRLGRPVSVGEGWDWPM